MYLDWYTSSPGRAYKCGDARDNLAGWEGILERGDSMDIAAFTQIISTVGFPIACVIAMFCLWNKEQEEHKTESEKWIEALNNNTNVMRNLLERLKDE